MKQEQLAQGLEPEEGQLFSDEQLKRNANSLGANQVIYSREIAPGQTMDYYVQPKTVTETTDTGGTIDFEDFELVPLGPGDDRNAAGRPDDPRHPCPARGRGQQPGRIRHDRGPARHADPSLQGQ